VLAVLTQSLVVVGLGARQELPDVGKLRAGSIVDQIDNDSFFSLGEGDLRQPGRRVEVDVGLRFWGCPTLVEEVLARRRRAERRRQLWLAPFHDRSLGGLCRIRRVRLGLLLPATGKSEDQARDSPNHAAQLQVIHWYLRLG